MIYFIYIRPMLRDKNVNANANASVNANGNGTEEQPAAVVDTESAAEPRVDPNDSSSSSWINRIFNLMNPYQSIASSNPTSTQMINNPFTHTNTLFSLRPDSAIKLPNSVTNSAASL